MPLTLGEVVVEFEVPQFEDTNSYADYFKVAKRYTMQLGKRRDTYGFHLAKKVTNVCQLDFKILMRS